MSDTTRDTTSGAVGASHATPARSTRIAPAVRRRIRIGLVVVLALPPAAAALVAFSLWSESRFPSDGPDGSLVARVRGTVTRPVVTAVGEFLRRRVRSRLSGPAFLLGLSREETVARFRDRSRDLADRRAYGYRLAHEGSAESVEALAAALADAPPEEREVMVQLLGITGARAAAPRLLPLLADPDERVAVAAIRGLSVVEGMDFTREFARILEGADRPAAVRTAAAVALGTSGTAEARETLTAAFLRAPHTDAALCALSGLGAFPFDDVAGTFEGILRAPDTPPEARAAAAEALSRSTQEAAPFLLDVAAHDADPEVRAAAAWAIGAHTADGDVGPKLADLAVREPDAFVRRRLYESLTRQTVIPAGRVLSTVMAERDVAARVAGFNAIGRAVGGNAAADVADVFDAEIVPELTRIAVDGNSLNIRMRAVFALRRGDTAAAHRALGTVAGTPCPQVAAAARRGRGPIE